MSIANLADDEFLRLADPFRRELFAHCYRMLGSVHDAEDLVQETYLRAWRAYGRFEGRSSLRTWLHTIATKACLSALDGKRRRPMPVDLGAHADPDRVPVQDTELPWLEPVADARVADPEAAATEREGLRLALIAAMQYLPPRQRAVLILREVLQWKAAEVAELLDTSVAAVNSMLQRARAQLAEVTPSYDGVREPAEQQRRELLDRYVAAFERKDIPELVELFSADIVWEMPPYPEWYLGPEAVGTHLRLRCPGGPGLIRMVPIAANGRTGFAQYIHLDGAFRAFNLQVLTLGPNGIAHVANFRSPELFAHFELPETLD
ncbi:sigma-70 family RNA polymerase sigma factor [Sciscionella marina]|uniref:sigma-70 family RNA polymerase sigma factor n=1 Tax=Sciscionella marina TaxID=508770 RepID=UPI0003777E9D|nr:sigma-70 family RNA polymerase sigma factor [Sciscionella marina]